MRLSGGTLSRVGGNIKIQYLLFDFLIRITVGSLRTAVSIKLYYHSAILRTYFLDGIERLDFARYLKSIVEKTVREDKTVVRAKFPCDLNPIYPVDPIESSTREHPEKL